MRCSTLCVSVVCVYGNFECDYITQGERRLISRPIEIPGKRWTRVELSWILRDRMGNEKDFAGTFSGGKGSERTKTEGESRQNSYYFSMFSFLLLPPALLYLFLGRGVPRPCRLQDEWTFKLWKSESHSNEEWSSQIVIMSSYPLSFVSLHVSLVNHSPFLRPHHKATRNHQEILASPFGIPALY